MIGQVVLMVAFGFMKSLQCGDLSYEGTTEDFSLIELLDVSLRDALLSFVRQTFNGWQGFLDNHDVKRDRGLSDFDVDHRLVASFVDHNNRNGTFAEVAAEMGAALSEPTASRGAAFGDLDDDGDIDVVINNLDGAPTILHNDGSNQNNYLVLDLIGSKSNRSAFGARVKVTAGDLVQIGEKRSGGSYLSQNDTRLHFELEKWTKVDSVEVRWPKGVTFKFTDIPINSFISIKEGEGSWQAWRAK